MEKIVILSGKGGVGKTMFTSWLALFLSKYKQIIAIDADVDAPNLDILLQSNKIEEKKLFLSEVAEVDEDKCIGCKKCFNNCAFSAIEWDDTKNKPIMDNMLCEGCGVCKLVCPNNAISFKKINNANVDIGKTTYGFITISGKLKPGESGSGKIVDEIKKMGEKRYPDLDMMIIDAAAGTSCPVIAAIREANFVIGIIEPTESSFVDLKKAIQIVENFQIHYKIIINKFDLNNKKTKEIEEYFKERDIEILGKIPYDKNIINSIVNLKIPNLNNEELEKNIKNWLNI